VKFIDTLFNDVKIIEPQVFGDERGYFMETFRADLFKENCANEVFIQDNHSKSIKGTLRGLHYQTENTQGKLVRVTAGEVFDVIVDVRQDSNTKGQWLGVTLSAENKKQLWVPQGFAHGFYVVSDSAVLEYKCTDIYNPDAEICLAWDDPEVNIDWPIIDGIPLILSHKDQQGLTFSNTPFI